MLRFDEGHTSLGAAARVLSSSYRQIWRLIERGELAGGNYRRPRRGRYVIAASVREFARRRFLDSVIHLTPKEFSTMTPKHPDQRHLDVFQSPPASPNSPANKPIDTTRPRRGDRNSDSTQDNKPTGFPAPSPKVPGNIPRGDPKDGRKPGEPV